MCAFLTLRRMTTILMNINAIAYVGAMMPLNPRTSLRQRKDGNMLIFMLKAAISRVILLMQGIRLSVGVMPISNQNA